MKSTLPEAVKPDRRFTSQSPAGIRSFLRTLPTRWRDFKDIIAIDFEFNAPPGEHPNPICLVANNLCTGVTSKWWADELREMALPPFEIGSQTLIVVYFGSAELGCFKALGWPDPKSVLDLYCEFRNLTNGGAVAHKAGLLDAARLCGIPVMETQHKTAMRDLCIAGGPYSETQRTDILEYCAEDVRITVKLFCALAADIQIDLGLLRGRYAAVVAAMERNGVPIDVPKYSTLVQSRQRIRERLIDAVDKHFGVYEDGRFKEARFRDYRVREGIAWPTLPSGRLSLASETFQMVGQQHPRIEALRQLRRALSVLRKLDLPIGRDHRNRTLLSPFRSKTGRNQPSTSKFIYGQSRFLRGLVRPPEGRVLVYMDYGQQEWGIAAALSGDPQMMADYRTSDPYLSFAKSAGAVPQNATKASHSETRAVYKQCAIGVMFGMGPNTLAERTGTAPIEAKALLQSHRRTYPVFWDWIEGALNFAALTGRIHTRLGWYLRTPPDFRPTSVQNFSMQANGAEILRLACIKAYESGVMLCAPIHDAILAECGVDEVEEHAAKLCKAMVWAGEQILDGFQLKVDVRVVHHPDTMLEDAGRPMWDLVQQELAALDREEAI